MGLPSPPAVLKNFFGAYPLELWNYLTRLVAQVAVLVGSPWQIVNITAAQSPYVASAGQWINVDSTNGDVHVTIPSALSAAVVVKKTAAPNNVIATPDHGLIDGAATQTLTLQWAAFTFVGQGRSIGAYIHS